MKIVEKIFSLTGWYIMVEKKYTEEPCSYCKGTGKYEGEECPACRGKATLLVVDPPDKCHFCKGQGGLMPGIPCRMCKGTGWMGVKKD